MSDVTDADRARAEQALLALHPYPTRFDEAGDPETMQFYWSSLLKSVAAMFAQQRALEEALRIYATKLLHHKPGRCERECVCGKTAEEALSHLGARRS